MGNYRHQHSASGVSGKRIIVSAQTQETFAFDADGNQTRDGRWTNSWGAENRLLTMVTQTNAPGASKLRLTFGYDTQWRRIFKTVESWNASAWIVTLSNKFVYDGWNLIAELNGTNNAVIRSYMWGSDLSGTMQGAGGVGGLLAVTDAAQGSYFVCFDGNGNVVALVNSASSATAARYEYGPFGGIVRSSGDVANKMPFRFSTKHADDGSDLVYYGYRHYTPSAGRWLSRDPIGESGATAIRLGSSRPGTGTESALYAFTRNGPSTKWDLLGLDVNDVVTVTAPIGVCPCKCGLAVDDLVKSIFDGVDAAWAAASDDQQDTACANLLRPPMAFDSWDMEGITGLPGIPGSTFCLPCSTRVTYRGRCFDPWELNYLFFGHICGLCDQRAKNHVSGSSWSSELVELIVDTGGGLRGKPVSCAAAIAGAGFLKKDPGCGNSSACTPNPQKAKLDNNTTRWRWSGIRQ
jgi:RHS repeat-associated protein